MEKYNYVTLFNVNYLSRGLVLYKSLSSVAKNFTLYVVCFDDATYQILKKLNYPNLVCISLQEFENEELLKIKPGRTASEYCWTCSSSVVWYCINNFKLTNCAYIDADMYFYSDPATIWSESPEASVLITLHNYSGPYDQSAISGRFCVQFVGFKNTPEGLLVLREWKDNCIDWCYNRVEDGKFGDQKYLDAWPEKYSGVYIVQNMTAGLAPWNIQQFETISHRQVIQKNTGKSYKPVFFHFHGLKIFKDHLVSFASNYYELAKPVIQEFYKPYAKELLETELFIKTSFPVEYVITHQQYVPQAFQPITWLMTYLRDIKSNLKNINPNFTYKKFANNYTNKIKL